MSYLEPILVHPVRRQNFRDTVAQKCNLYLIRCHTADTDVDDTAVLMLMILQISR